MAEKGIDLPIKNLPDLELATTVSKVLKINRSTNYVLDESKSATGFFYQHKSKLYFVTNWHVVNDIGVNGPNALLLRLHSKAGVIPQPKGNHLFDLRINEEYIINL
jgi:hypothetical protein